MYNVRLSKGISLHVLFLSEKHNNAYILLVWNLNLFKYY